MDHENFTYIPNDHVSHSLLRRVLGVSGSNSALCTSSRINRYSRRKPYDFGAVGVQLYGANGTNEDIVLMNNFGMTPAIITKPADGSASNIDGAQTARDCVKPWGQWQPPQNGHVKRIDDFRQYWKLATEHVKSVEYSSGSVPKLMSNRLFTAKIEFNDNNGRIVTLNDMSHGGVRIGAMYFTVVIGAYRAAYTLPSGSKVAAAWGVKWIVAQCTTQLDNAVTGMGQSKKLEMSFDLSTSGVQNLSSDFSRYFIAAGFAPLFSQGTVLTASSGTSLRYYVPSSGNAMPLTLISPDMYGDGIALAEVGTLTPDVTLVEKYFAVVCDLSTDNFAASVTSATKNGQKGFSVNLNGRISCNIRSVESGVASTNGFLVFFFMVEATSTSGEQFYQEYYVMMKQGVNSTRSIYLTNSAVTSAVPALAQNGDQWVSDAKEWFEDKWSEFDPVELSNGIFIPFNGGLSSVLVSVEVMGAPTPDGISTLYIPQPKKSNFGNIVLDLYNY